MYIGALNAIETSIEIGKFHLNNIQKNFNVNTIISFNNGIEYWSSTFFIKPICNQNDTSNNNTNNS